MDQLSKLVGSVFGLAAFAVALIAGISSGNVAAQVLFNAIVCMMVCYVVGTLLGLIAERTVAEHAGGYAADRAVPEIPMVTPVPETASAPGSAVHDGGRAG